MTRPTDSPRSAPVAGVVLAAGRSRRMGSPKPLLLRGGRTFLAHAVDALRGGGCDPVLVVAGPPGLEGADAVAEEGERAGARVVRNPDPDAEQVESLRVALRALPADAGAALVLPADVPAAGPDAARAVVDAFRRSGAPVARAVHGGRHGHPVLFARALFGELLEGTLPEGARSVVHAHADRLVEVEVDEPGVLVDVDRPADLDRLPPT